MAEKSNEKKMTVAIEGKYILAAFDVPKSSMKQLNARRILQGVHIRVDKSGRWMAEGCDSYKLARISNGYIGGKHEWFDFMLPPETVSELKASDMLEFEPNLEKMTCKLTRYAKGVATEWVFNLIDGKYPDTDKLMPGYQPLGCYRYAHLVSADHLAVLMGVVRKSLGKDEGVAFSTEEGKSNRPIVGYAENDGIEVTVLVMPQKMDDHPKFAKEAPRGRDERAVSKVRKELEIANSNLKMWKEKALKLENEGDAKLSEELEEAKAERDKLAEELKAEKAKRNEKKGVGKLEDKVKELEAELSKAKAELEDVWKENEMLKRSTQQTEAPEPESKAEPAPKSDEAATFEVSLETMQAWCEGKGLKAKQMNERSSIWVLGPSLPYKDELETMGARWGTSKKFGKGWYISPSAD